MAKLNIHKLINIYILAFCFSVSNIFGGTDLQSNSIIEWKGLQEYTIENEKIQYLDFKGSLFTDTLPYIPYHFERIKMDVPHVSYEISLADKEIEEVTPLEKDFLKRVNFKTSNFTINTKSTTERGVRFLETHLIPIRYNANQDTYEKLVSFSIKKSYVYDAKYSTKSAQKYAEQSVLASGNWYKLCIEETGVYKLDYSYLEELGINPDEVKKEDISLFGNGTGMLPEANDAPRHDDLKENAIYVSGNPGNNFSKSDYILFYGKSPHQWSFNESKGFYEHEVHLYSGQNCYFLSTNVGEGKRIVNRDGLNNSPDSIITTFVDYSYHQNDQYNLIESGKTWYGELFNITLSRDFHFSFNDLVKDSQGFLHTHLAAHSSNTSSFSIEVGNTQSQVNIPKVPSSTSTGYKARYVEEDIYFSQAGSNIPITISYNRTATGGKGWLNYIALNVERKLHFRKPQLLFRATGLQEMIAEYRLSNIDDNITVWDVSDRFNIKSQLGNKEEDKFTFKVQGKEKMSFVAFDGSNYLEPSLKGKIPNQNLHGNKVHDMVIVTPPKFLNEAERLGSFRSKNDGLSVLVVTTEEVYNEFSSGVPDISAIRNFMKMFYDRADNSDQMPKYLLLFGNGTYDNKDILGYGGNLIPTFQTKESLNYSSSWISDDFFGLLADGEGENATGNLDIGIGRLPARTLNDASIIADKIIRYDKRIEGWDYIGYNYDFAGMVSNYGDWRNKVALIADDGDNNVHLNDAEYLYDIMINDFPVYNTEKIYLDSYDKVVMASGERYPEVNKVINNLVNRGALLINYIGHGGYNGLAHERVLTFDDIQTWNNYYNLPVFMTATCQFSTFDRPDPSSLSAGVRIFLKPDGGAAALFTTTRLAWAGSNKRLNNNFMSNAFKPMDNGKYPRLGDMIRKAKVESGSGNNIMNFVLLGDPSMQLAFPEHKVKTTFVQDTMKAFDKVNIKGKVVNNQGNLISDYNGVVYPTVYDKKKRFTTLGNSSDSNPAEFEMRNNTLYKGKVTVENGIFEFDFIVPKDIGYKFGEGKISYYTDDDGNTDGHGYYDQFHVGGTADNYEPDYEGPQIELYLNDTTFISGETVNSNPILIAHLFDESGINTTGELGHDIVAILNDNRTNQHVLNDFYESSLDTYKSGKVVYPLSGLEEGEHTLKLRVWDTHNNPSVSSIKFIVAGSSEFAIENLVNYPNPFSYNTTFKFTHNNFDDYKMDVKIEIFNISGQKVSNINETINITGFDSFRIDWDGTNDSGSMLEQGFYLYKVTVSTPDGKTASESSKLVIIK